MFTNCKIGKRDIQGIELREGMSIQFKLISFYGNEWVKGRVIYKEDICAFAIEVSKNDKERSKSISDDFWRFDTKFDFIEVLN